MNNRVYTVQLASVYSLKDCLWGTEKDTYSQRIGYSGHLRTEQNIVRRFVPSSVTGQYYSCLAEMSLYQYYEQALFLLSVSSVYDQSA